MLAGVKEAWQPLRTQWLGQRVLLSFDDRTLNGTAVSKGRISTPAWQSMLPAQALQRGMPELVDGLGDFLGDLLLSMGLGGQPLRIALPPEAAHWRVIAWPFDDWPDEPIDALRTIDPDLGLPYALADAAIDLQPLPGQPLRSLLVAAPRALVDAWVEVVNIAGAPLERLLPSQVCLRVALLNELEQLDPQAGVLLLLPGNSGLCLAQLWQQGVPLYERRLAIDDPQLIDQIQTLVAFYRSRDNGFLLRHLWLVSPLERQEHLAAALGLPLEQPDCAPYDSPVLQGLALVR